MIEIQTERLKLRQWRQEDLEPFAALNADPRVREYFPGLLTSNVSDGHVQLMSDHIEKYGWGFWAASLLETDQFIGFIGLEDVNFEAHFTPAVEIGWRLGHEYWGKGYATEGARACLQYGFEKLNFQDIVSFTTLTNQRSRHVMEKIGMHHVKKDDFDHPKLDLNHPLSKHVLYRLSINDWQSKQNLT
jgi:3-dehydroquinate dehydratase/shikimate dehydrogenase